MADEMSPLSLGVEVGMAEESEERYAAGSERSWSALGGDCMAGEARWGGVGGPRGRMEGWSVGCGD